MPDITTQTQPTNSMRKASTMEKVVRTLAPVQFAGYDIGTALLSGKSLKEGFDIACKNIEDLHEVNRETAKENMKKNIEEGEDCFFVSPLVKAGTKFIYNLLFG